MPSILASGVGRVSDYESGLFALGRAATFSHRRDPHYDFFWKMETTCLRKLLLYARFILSSSTSLTVHGLQRWRPTQAPRLNYNKPVRRNTASTELIYRTGN